MRQQRRRDGHVAGELGEQRLLETGLRRNLAMPHPAMDFRWADIVRRPPVMAVDEPDVAAGHAVVVEGRCFRPGHLWHLGLAADLVRRARVHQHQRRGDGFPLLAGLDR